MTILISIGVWVLSLTLLLVSIYLNKKFDKPWTARLLIFSLLLFPVMCWVVEKSVEYYLMGKNLGL